MFRVKSHPNRLITLLLFALLSCACQSNKAKNIPKSAQETDIATVQLTSGLIEPTQGIKEVKLGDARIDVEQSLGAPSERDKNDFVEGQTYLLYYAKGIELTLQDDVVQQITVHAGKEKWSAYAGATSEGAGVSLTGKEIVDLLGAADEQTGRALTYKSKGLKFRFNKTWEGDGANTRAESLSLVKPES